MYFIQACIQSIIFNRKALQMIGSASKIILLLMASSQINPNMEFCVNWNVGVWSIQNKTN
jgi:hypothetical protein